MSIISYTNILCCWHNQLCMTMMFSRGKVLEHNFETMCKRAHVHISSVLTQLDHLDARSSVWVQVLAIRSLLTSERIECIVNTMFHTCSCGKWQSTNLPCRHVVVSLNKACYHHILWEYNISNYLIVDSLIHKYRFWINPIVDRSSWPTSDEMIEVRPPKYSRGASHPRITRLCMFMKTWRTRVRTRCLRYGIVRHNSFFNQNSWMLLETQGITSIN